MEKEKEVEVELTKKAGILLAKTLKAEMDFNRVNKCDIEATLVVDGVEFYLKIGTTEK